MINEILQDRENGIKYQVTKQLGKLLVLKSTELEKQKTIRRPAKTILEGFSIVEGTKTVKQETTIKPVREARDNLNIKRIKKVQVDIEAIEQKAKTKLAEAENISEDILELEFDYAIGQELLIPFTAIRLLSNEGRVNYMAQKLNSEDEWAKLMYYCWTKRAELKSSIKWDDLEEIAVKALGSKNKPKSLNATKVIKELDKLIDYRNTVGRINFDYYTDIVEALPDGHNGKPSYYLFAIATLLFSKNEWGSLGLNKHLIRMVEEMAEKL